MVSYTAGSRCRSIDPHISAEFGVKGEAVHVDAELFLTQRTDDFGNLRPRPRLTVKQRAWGIGDRVTHGITRTRGTEPNNLAKPI